MKFKIPLIVGGVYVALMLLLNLFLNETTSKIIYILNFPVAFIALFNNFTNMAYIALMSLILYVLIGFIIGILIQD